MAHSAWASVEDVRSRWIASTFPPDDSIISAYLQDASELIDAEFPELRSTPSLEGRARLVCMRMVLRVLGNPDQIRSMSNAEGPFNGSITYATETLSGLGLTDADRKLLSPYANTVNRAFEIDPLEGR